MLRVESDIGALVCAEDVALNVYRALHALPPSLQQFVLRSPPSGFSVSPTHASPTKRPDADSLPAAAQNHAAADDDGALLQHALAAECNKRPQLQDAQALECETRVAATEAASGSDDDADDVVDASTGRVGERRSSGAWWF